jgi:hypothetical protein
MVEGGPRSIKDFKDLPVLINIIKQIKNHKDSLESPELANLANEELRQSEDSLMFKIDEVLKDLDKISS